MYAYNEMNPKIVHHKCQILRFMNKTPPQSMIPTRSENVVSPSNAHLTLTRIDEWTCNAYHWDTSSMQQTFLQDFLEILKQMKQNFQKILNKFWITNEWPCLSFSVHTEKCQRNREAATLKHNAYNKIHSSNYLNVCICLTIA